MGNKENMGCGTLALMCCIALTAVGYARYDDASEQAEKESYGCRLEFQKESYAKGVSPEGVKNNGIQVQKIGEKCVASIAYKDGKRIQFDWPVAQVSNPTPSDMQPL